MSTEGRKITVKGDGMEVSFYVGDTLDVATAMGLQMQLNNALKLLSSGGAAFPKRKSYYMRKKEEALAQESVKKSSTGRTNVWNEETLREFKRDYDTLGKEKTAEKWGLQPSGAYAQNQRILHNKNGVYKYLNAGIKKRVVKEDNKLFKGGKQ